MAHIYILVSKVYKCLFARETVIHQQKTSRDATTAGCAVIAGDDWE